MTQPSTDQITKSKTFLKKKILNLKKNPSILHILALTTGTAISQLANIAAAPILTRIYNPEDFGTSGMLTAIIGIVAVIAGLRYELAIPIPKQKKTAANLLALAILCVITTTIISSIFVALFKKQIVLLINSTQISEYLYIIPIGIFVSGIYQALNYWQIREKKFLSISNANMLQGTTTSAAQVGLGLLKVNPLGLIIGPIIGQFISVITLAKSINHKDKPLSKIDCKRIIKSGKEFIRFPKYSSWQSLLNVSSTMLPLILISALISTEVAGLYILAHRMLSAPLGLLGRSISQVFYSKAVEAHHTNTLSELTIEAVSRLFLVGVGPLVAIGILAPDLFEFAFGEKWRQSGIYASWMAPWLIMQFLTSPISVIPGTVGQNHGDLISQIFFFIIRNLTLLLGIFYLNGSSAIKAFAISGFIVYAGYFLWVIRIANAPVSSIMTIIKRHLPITITLISIAIIAKILIS